MEPTLTQHIQISDFPDSLISIIEMNRYYQRDHERNLYFAIKGDLLVRAKASTFWDEVRTQMIRINGRERGTIVATGEQKMQFGESAVVSTTSLTKLADQFGIDVQALETSRSQFIASLAFVAHHKIGLQIPVAFTNTQYQKYQQLVELDRESQSYKAILKQPEVAKRLDEVSHVASVLEYYTKYLTLTPLFNEMDIPYTPSSMGEYNKNVRSFLRGNLEGGGLMRRLSRRVLLARWLNASDQNRFINTASKNLTQMIPVLLENGLKKSHPSEEKLGSTKRFFRRIAEIETHTALTEDEVIKFYRQYAGTSGFPRALKDITRRYLQKETMTSLGFELAQGQVKSEHTSQKWVIGGISFLEKALINGELPPNWENILKLLGKDLGQLTNQVLDSIKQIQET